MSALYDLMECQQDLMDAQHTRTLDLMNSALKGLSDSNRIPLSNLSDFGRPAAASSCHDQSGRA